MTSAVTQHTTRLLTPDTWHDFAALVEANNGVWGGCWCIGFHPEGLSKDSTVAGNRAGKLAHVNNGTVHQMLVYRDGRCVGWCQYGSPAEVATIKNPRAYQKDLAGLPDWRIGCLFTGSGSRRQGVARAGVAAVLAAIAQAGGGLVEAYPEQVAGRDPQRGAYLHTGPESLFEEFGFVRDRRIAKWRWVMRLRIPALRATWFTGAPARSQVRDGFGQPPDCLVEGGVGAAEVDAQVAVAFGTEFWSLIQPKTSFGEHPLGERD